MKAYGFIYVTENLINHKKYIGQRKYDNDGRWQKYLGSGNLLRRAIKKYGKENFKKTIIDTAFNRDELNEKEKFWINFFEATKNGEYYNIAEGGTGGNTKFGYTPEEYALSEAKRTNAVSRSCKLRYGEKASMTKLTEKQVREIISELIRGKFHTELANKYNVSICAINDIANHKTWGYLTKGVVFPKITREMVGKRSALHTSKPIMAYLKDESFVGEFASAREVERTLGVDFRLVSQVCNGSKPSAHGYIFRFANNT